MGRISNANQRREEIVQALFDCLAENGHETVTVKQIAAQADLPHGVIHYYFNRKDDIVAALVVSMAIKYNQRFDEVLASVPAPLERLDRMLEYLMEAFVFDRKLNRVFYNLVQMGFERKEVNAPLRRMLMAYRGTIKNVLTAAGAGTRSGSLACLLVAVIEGLALQWMIDPDALKKETVRIMVKQTIKNQLMFFTEGELS